MSDHDEGVERISKQFENKGFQVQTRENNLLVGAGRNDAIYRPDIIVRNSEGQIIWLVEVEKQWQEQLPIHSTLGLSFGICGF